MFLFVASPSGFYCCAFFGLPNLPSNRLLCNIKFFIDKKVQNQMIKIIKIIVIHIVIQSNTIQYNTNMNIIIVTLNRRV